MYKSRGFNINVYHGDNEFNINYLGENTRPSNLNIYAQGINIPTIKKSIQTINQGARCTTNSVPYKKYTRLMTISLVEFIINSRRSFPQ